MGDYNTHPIKGVLNELMNLYGWKDKIDETRALDAYEKCIDAETLKATKNVYIKNRILHIELISAAARNNLQYKTEELKQAINHKIGRAILSDITLY